MSNTNYPMPPQGQPTPYTLVGPPAVYFSPLEGVKPPPEDLINSVRLRLPGVIAAAQGDVVGPVGPLRDDRPPFVSPGLGGLQ